MNDERWGWTMDTSLVNSLTPDEPSTPVMESHHFPISFAAWDIVMVVASKGRCFFVSL